MSKEKFNFGRALEELKAISAEFDRGNLDLDQALKKFSRGLELAKACKERLQEVENKVIEIKEKFAKLEKDFEEEMPEEEV